MVRPMALVPGLTEVEVRSRALSRVGSLCASADAFRRSKMSAPLQTACQVLQPGLHIMLWTLNP